jgi:RNA polymerase sigma-70 factor (ECF subfamily)
MASIDPAWTEITKGSKPAFLKIYQENYKHLFSYGFSLCYDKELTKDCIQSMFLEIWSGRAVLSSEVQNVPSYLRTWLRRKINRSVSEKNKIDLSDNLSLPTENEKSYEELLVAFQESEEQKEKVKLALRSLTPKQLDIIRLKYYENLSYEQIAERTSLTTRTVYNTVFEAISRLRKIIHIFI